MSVSLLSSGAIPESLGGLTNLTLLILGSNQLSGDVLLISIFECQYVSELVHVAAGRMSLSLLISGTDVKMSIVVCCGSGLLVVLLNR